jgi:hypothetical protein
MPPITTAALGRWGSGQVLSGWRPSGLSSPGPSRSTNEEDPLEDLLAFGDTFAETQTTCPTAAVGSPSLLGRDQHSSRRRTGPRVFV